MPERVLFGKTGQKVSSIGMGTYYDPGWIFSARLFKKRPNVDLHIKAIRAGIESGINLIDTAEIYETEGIVKEAIKGYDREDLFLATKVWPTHFNYDSVIKSCERSLSRLGVDYIDLYQLHFPSRTRDISVTMKAMEHLVDLGKIRHIGISNFSLEQTKEAVETMKKYEIVSTQMNYSVARRNIEKDLLPYCKDNSIAVLAYYPLGHGKLVSESSVKNGIAGEIGKNHGGKTTPQIVLNWFTSKYDFVFPIPRASNPEHVTENARSMGWKMNEEEIVRLESAFA